MGMPLLVCAIFCGSLCAQPPYKNGQYVTITNGISPDHRFALAAHGDGASGTGHFQVYLVSELAHKKVSQVTQLSNMIVAAPKRYEAFWSPDSSHVALSYIDRTSQHSNTLELFRIENGKAIPIVFRSPLSALTEEQGITDLWKTEARAYHEAGSSEIKWLSNTRFILMDREWLTSPTQRLAKVMGQYAKTQTNQAPASAKQGNVTYDTVLSVFATCELERRDTVRIVSLKPGKHSFQR